ncbi:MAG: S8 family serine peptidase [Actinomycetota bacterium]
MPRHARTAPRILGAIALLCGLTVATGAPSEAQVADDRGPSFEIGGRRRSENPRLAPSLHDDLAAGHAVPSPLAKNGDKPGAPKVTVVVEATESGRARSAVAASGGTVLTEVPGLIKAAVPAGALGRLSRAAGVTLVREPYPAQVQTTSEGVGSTNASTWHSLGHEGAGTKVAIVDVGFQDYVSKLGTELPLSPGVDLTRCDSPFDEVHGTAVAEIVHDMAPAAELLLVCVKDDVTFASALASLNAQGVDIVNASIGFTLTGRGDGSGGAGTPAGAVAALRDQGILYVAAAGNYGGRHYQAKAVGDPVQGRHPLDGDTDFVDLSGNTFTFQVAGNTAPGNGIAQVSMRWDSWPTTNLDLDVYVRSYTCGNPAFNYIVAGSEFDQTTQAGPPVEQTNLFQNCSSSPQTFEVLINRWSGSGTPRLDLFFDGPVGNLERTNGGDVAEPATSPAALAVGAHCYLNPMIQPYSSTGPTIDGRIKPDLAGPDATSSSVYGDVTTPCTTGFTGTSAAAPHVAGAAAVLLGTNPDMDVAELEQVLRSKATDINPPGLDNQWGSGKLALPQAGILGLDEPQPITTVTPVRLFDSRPGTLGASESVFGVNGRTTPLNPQATLRVPVAGIANVPTDATAVVLNVTVTQPTAGGFLAVYPGTTTPIASNMNFGAGQTVAQHVTATVGTDDKVQIKNGSSGTTHVIIDLAGWYGPTGLGGAPAADWFTPRSAPARAMDTRSGTLGYAEGAFGPSGRTTPISQSGNLDVQVAGLGGVPADATAVVMNVTITQPTTGGYVVLHPTGTARPLASTLNYSKNQTIANLVIGRVGTAGKVRVGNCCGPVHVVIDVLGWYESGTGAGYVALDPPMRDLDSRSGNGPRLGALGGGSTFKLKVARYYQVPSDAAAVMLGIIAVTPTANGYLTVYPATATRPLASNLNFSPGKVIPNAVITAFGTDGRVAFYNSGGSTHLVSDLAGYFIDPAFVGAP